MKSLLVIVAAAVAFAAFVLVTQHRADDLIDREEVALAEVRRLGRDGPGPAREAGGYRFAWVDADDLPALLVARPLRHGRDGIRWFATADGRVIYQFDTVVYRARDNRPDLHPLRYFLSLPADERTEPPFGWRPVAAGP